MRLYSPWVLRFRVIAHSVKPDYKSPDAHPFNVEHGWSFKKGAGMFKANVLPLVAEQYKRTKLFVVVTSNNEKIIVDPALTVSRVYMVCFSFPFQLVRWLKKLVLLSLHQYRITHWTNHSENLKVKPTLIDTFKNITDNVFQVPWILWHTLSQRSFSSSIPSSSSLAAIAIFVPRPQAHRQF